MNMNLYTELSINLSTQWPNAFNTQHKTIIVPDTLNVV